MTGSSCRVCSAPTDAFLCRPCTARVERAVAEAPSLLHELGNVITRSTRVYRSSTPRQAAEPVYDPEAQLPARLRTRDGRIALRPTSLPVNLDASELLFVAWNTYGGWARIIAEHHGGEGDWPTSANLLQWLLAHVESLRWQDDAGEAFDELCAIHRDLERAVDRSPERYYAGPCANGECKVLHDGEVVPRDLYAWPGRDEITCDGWRSDGLGCRATYTTGERREWLRQAVREHLSSLAALMDAIPSLFPELPVVPRGSVMGWVRDGRLMPHGLNRFGEDTYRGDELLGLMERYQPKRFASRPKRRCA